MERIQLVLSNSDNTEQKVRLLFEKGPQGIHQRIGSPNTGISAILRNKNGNPTGIPVQLSKNWHGRPEDGVHNGLWFHGFSQIVLPPKTTLELELSLVYGHWGGVAAASHAQLCLIGWGSNQQWDESALGSWGESICYEPDQVQAAAAVLDVRSPPDGGRIDGIVSGKPVFFQGPDASRFFLPYNGGIILKEVSMPIDIQLYSGNEMEPEIGILGEFRLRYFHEFPYLYVGTPENEQGHTAEYLANPSTRFLVARDGENLVGVGIGTLLSTEKDILEQTSESFRQHGLNPDDFFYFGEMIFMPGYRNRGIGRRMLDMLKKAGEEQGATRFCFLAVDRDADDPLRPPNTVDSATIFQKFGFRKTPIQVVFEWPTIQADGSVGKTANTLSLWIDETSHPTGADHEKMA